MLYSSNSIAGTWMTNPIRISPSCRRNGQAGFTVMELLIGIAVLAILTTLAVPAFTQFIQNNRLASEANEMVAAFQFARSEALKRGVQVEVCSSANGESCGGNWNQGWIAPHPSQPEPLRVWASPGDDFEFTPTNGSVGFEPDGFATAAAQFDLVLDGCSTDSARQIRVELTGRVASQRVDCPE